ncbi:MAG: DUF4906 domain-containing protein [Bacteroides sp.]|nr:DUF4906 domain-containing protein [Bacteroides sp.]
MNRTNIPLLPATLCLCAAWLVCTTTACTDRIETDTVLPDGGETVEVNVRLGFAPEENAADAATDTRTDTGKDKGQAFSAQLQAEANTRETTEEYTTPDGLYELNVMQFKADGTSLLTTSTYKSGKTDIGSVLSISLAASDDCQLVIIARGKGASSGAIGTTTISALQALSFDRDVIDAIPTSGATQEQMNAMPYVLHLKHVKVVKENSVGKLQSPDVNSDNGPQDVRLMLKRLAAKVTVNWNYGVKVNSEQYTLKQLLLQSIPLKFNYIPTPSEKDGSYPDPMDQYTALTATVDAPDESGAQKGSYSFWVPANVRADNPAVSSELLRSKDNAPSNSSYLTFEAVNNKNVNKKFRYRLYIGDDNPQNFSIRQNTDYIYNIDFTHTTIPTQDRRVTYVDPIPASQNNNNFVPTANCFMVKPGGSFCFDPFLFRRVENGERKDVENTVLTGWAKDTNRGGICYVKVEWQTHENGDAGEPVLGIVNSDTDHTNIVQLADADNNPVTSVSTAGYTEPGQCRIHCRVAPGTTGGNGLIAAYGADNKILWSWHLWVTDYNPDPHGDASVLDDPNKRKQKYVGNSADDQLPMMDRNLGALAGYVDMSAVENDAIARSRAGGTMYQRGRKDPFLGSFSTKTITSVTVGANNTVPVDGLQNMYGPDGYSFIPRTGSISGAVSYVTAYQNPYKSYSNGDGNFEWASPNLNDWDGNVKGFHDPSPAGWRIPSIANFTALFNGNATNGSRTSLQIPRGISSNDAAKTFIENSENKGLLVQYDDNADHKTFFWMTGYCPNPTQYVSIGQYGWILGRERGMAFLFGVANGSSPYYNLTQKGTTNENNMWFSRDAHGIRCIQEAK